MPLPLLLLLLELLLLLLLLLLLAAAKLINPANTRMRMARRMAIAIY
jgi:hypothetical protein